MENEKDPALRQVMMCLGEAIRTIAFKVRTASCGATACVNTFGDEQLAVDLLADKLLFEALKYSGAVKYACSEEVPEPVDLQVRQWRGEARRGEARRGGGRERKRREGGEKTRKKHHLPSSSLSILPSQGSGFSVAFDPLDGSSIVDTNFTVGTIFGVWPGDKLTGITGRDQVSAGMGIYGPRTVYCLALKGAPGCHEFLLQDDGKWLHVKETTEIGEGKMFSPGNLRATFDNPEYEKLISHYIGEKYTLRYTGGMVPDVFQIIVKEKGVFTNVISPTTKAKLRLLLEVAPLALMVEKAGGASSADGLCVSGLDIEVKKWDQRTQICYGSVGEVKKFEEYLYGASPRFANVAAA